MYLSLAFLSFILYQNRRELSRFYQTVHSVKMSHINNLYNTLSTAGSQYISSLFDRNTFLTSPDVNGSILTFYVSEMPFKILIKKPSDAVIMIDMISGIDSTEKSAYNELRPFLGPYGDFYGIRYTPKDFGYKNLRVDYIKNGSTFGKSFEENDVIIL